MNKSTLIIVGAIAVVLILIGYVVMGRSSSGPVPTTGIQHVENDGHAQTDHATTGAAAHDDTGAAPH